MQIFLQSFFQDSQVQ